MKLLTKGIIDKLEKRGRVEEYKDKKDADKASKMFRSAVPVSATTDLQPTV